MKKLVIISIILGVISFTSCKKIIEPNLELSIEIKELYDDNADSVYDRASFYISVINPSSNEVNFEKYTNECFDENNDLIFKETVMDPYPYTLKGLDKYTWDNIKIKLNYEGKRVKKYKFTLFYSDENRSYSSSAEINLY